MRNLRSYLSVPIAMGIVIWALLLVAAWNVPAHAGGAGGPVMPVHQAGSIKAMRAEVINCRQAETTDEQWTARERYYYIAKKLSLRLLVASNPLEIPDFTALCGQGIEYQAFGGAGAAYVPVMQSKWLSLMNKAAHGCLIASSEAQELQFYDKYLGYAETAASKMDAAGNPLPPPDFWGLCGKGLG